MSSQGRAPCGQAEGMRWGEVTIRNNVSESRVPGKLQSTAQSPEKDTHGGVKLEIFS